MIPAIRAWALIVAGILLIALMPSPAVCQDSPGNGEAAPVAAADAEIQAKLDAVFQKIEAFQGLRAQVAGGVVVLTGRTPSFRSAEKALELTAKIPGVLYVSDNIQVEAEVDSYITPAWRKIRQVADQSLGFAPLIGIAALLLLAFYLVGRWISLWDWPYRRMGGKVLLQSLVRQFIRYVFVFVGLLIALEILGLTALIGAFMGAAGIIGLALGFAFKDIVENYVAGFLLSIRSPFAFMDWIGVDKHEGSVVRVTPRELVIMTLEGNHVRIPNALVFKSVIYNYTRNPFRRFDIDVGVGVGEDLSRVQKVGLSVLGAMKGVAADPGPTMRNLAFGDSTMLVRFSGWVDQASADFLKVRSEAVRILKETLDNEGIDVPVPIQKVISVGGESLQPPQEAKPSREGLYEDARLADVGRESYLDEQIEKDRRTSEDVDLLTEK